jgi:hypothetical protein
MKIIVAMYFLSLSLYASDCQQKKLCLVSEGKSCLKQTEAFCDEKSNLPVTRPVLFQGEIFEVYIEREWEKWALSGFFYQLARDYQNTNKTEMLIAEHYRMSLLNLKAAMSFAKKIEKKLCGSDHSINDAADAVRHFSFSAYLAFFEGREAAESFLTAHETLLSRDLKNMKSFRRKMRSLKMDYFNNNLGVEFSTYLSPYLSTSALKNEIENEVKENLSSDHFTILKTGNTLCD